MKLIKLDHRINHSSWYIIPSFFRSLRDSVESYQKETLERLRSQDMQDMFSMLLNQRPPMSIDDNGIASISISGILARDCSPLEKLLGFTGYEDIAADVEDAQSEKARGYMFTVDSPGGQCSGAPETADIIAGITQPKVSWSGGMDCSAAYYLSSSMDKKFSSASAMSGSIGTIVPHINEEKLWDEIGISWEPITGENESLKGSGIGPNFTEEQRAHIQEMVNSSSATFRDHVSNYRSVPFAKLQAGSFSGKKAVDFRLVDKIGSAGDAYKWLLRQVDKK